MLKAINFNNFFSLIFGVLFFYFSIRYIFFDFQISNLIYNLKDLYDKIILGYFFFLLHIGCNLYRWLIFVRVFNKNVRLINCIEPFLISVGINYISPVKFGDAYRVYKNAEILNIDKKELLSCVIIERLLDFFSLFLILILGILLFFYDEIFKIKLYLAIFLIIIFFSSILFIFSIKFLNKIYKKIILLNEIKKIIFNYAFIKIIILTIVTWLFELICFYILFEIIFNNTELSKILIVHSGSILSIVFPSGPGLIGPVDYTITSLLEFFSFKRNNIEIFVITFHFYIFLSFILIFLFWLTNLIKNFIKF